MKLPELLAPAGNLASGITAFENGADAVYCGLKRFSARDRAENFSFDDLSRLLVYAHERGKKVYLAFNTLVKESEILDAASAIAKIAELGVDAIIVQDLGILQITRDFFPFLPIHASTQMAIHNSASAKIAKKMGISRVILERQLTFSEIQNITANSPVEVEIFIHGAICCSLSGQCLLSSWIGGYSGNRGKCKQACRFPSTDGSKYPLSTRDLCMADAIFALKKVKIAAFKIEGRLRSLDYIKNVVSAYRLLLDSDETNFASALKEAKHMISLSCGRDYVSLFKNNFNEMINPNRSGASGVKCGELRRVNKHGFFAWISGRIHLGDKIRIQKESGASATSFTVKRIIKDGRDLKSARNELVFIPCDRELEKDSYIYKIGESIATDVAKFANLPLFEKRKVDIKIHFLSHAIQIKIPSFRLEWKKFHIFQSAKKHPIDPDTVKKLFSETASDKFLAGDIDVYIDGNYFTPISELKQIRRDFWIWVSENLKIENSSSKTALNALKTFQKFYENLKSSISSAEKAEKYFKIPSFCPENLLPELSAKLRNEYKSGIREFHASSLAHFELLKDISDLKIVASFPLQCSNSLAACEFRKLGAERVQAWVELEKNELEKLMEKSPLPIEIFSEGQLPLLYTRGNIDGDFCEIREKKFPIQKTKEGLSILLSNEIFETPLIKKQAKHKDKNSDNESLPKSSFNYYKEWK